jgi:hypothetical protein
MSSNLPSINRISQIMGGDVAGGEALVPGPGHSAEDRSLAVKLDGAAPDGFVTHSFAGDDPIVCRDFVRKKLGLPEFEPKKKASGSSSKNKKGNSAAKPWSPIIARYVYRNGRHAVFAGLPDRRQRVFPEQVEWPNVGRRQAGRPEDTVPLARATGCPTHNKNTHHRG